MLRTIRPVARSCSVQRCHRSTVAAADSDQQVVTDYDRAKPFDEIPGPPGLPYLGTMLQYRKGPFKKYDTDRFQYAVMDRYMKYGKIVKETVAGATVVHLFDPDYIRTVFQAEGKLPHVAPLMETTQMYRQQKGLALGLGNTNGEEWYRLRSAVQQMMMRPKAVTVYLPLVENVADAFIQRLKKIRVESNLIPNLRNEISKWNVQSAAATVFEMDLDCLNARPNSEVQRMIDANTEMFQLTAYLKFRIPFHKWFKTPTWKRLVEAEECIVKTSQKYLDETVGKMRAMLDMDELEEDNYKFIYYLLSRKELTQKDISIICLSLFGDGLGTTSPTLASNLYCLAKYRDVQDKIYEEIKRVVPSSGPITADMINNMSYLKAFVKEAFRFFPIGLDVARIPQQNLVIGGYQIPAGTHLELNNFVMFKDPKYFEDPERFMPERWLRDGSAKDIHPFILTPFGHGPRMCAGRRFAEQEMYVVITKILQNFRLEWKFPDLSQKFQILMVPDSPIHVTFIDR